MALLLVKVNYNIKWVPRLSLVEMFHPHRNSESSKKNDLKCQWRFSPGGGSFRAPSKS